MKIKFLILKKKINLSKTLFIIISKSGNTVETISNTFSLDIVKKNAKNIIIISEKKNNLLFNLSKKLNLFYVEHKSNIGGRYSVLSEVGIVPAYLMGLNIFKLRSKLLDYLTGNNKKYLKESSIIISSILNSKRNNNLIFLNYCPELEKFLFWCQQLIAESLGKKNKGFLPIISNVPKDHHSMLQLYLDGPKDKIFYIFSSHNNRKLRINLKYASHKYNFLNKKTLSSLKNAQKNALIKAFKENKILFREFRINRIDEEIIGKLFSYFIFETIIVGKLCNINPYNQPAVEQVKIYTKQELS
ncbi:MAG: glucose-6-phosphate isomerase [Pelagibacteraceae bacterium]|nr:glucose-6-phosphate isomerase [Pelagibacteraceae bacterium]